MGAPSPPGPTLSAVYLTNAQLSHRIPRSASRTAIPKVQVLFEMAGGKGGRGDMRPSEPSPCPRFPAVGTLGTRSHCACRALGVNVGPSSKSFDEKYPPRSERTSSGGGGRAVEGRASGWDHMHPVPYMARPPQVSPPLSRDTTITAWITCFLLCSPWSLVGGGPLQVRVGGGDACRRCFHALCCPLLPQPRPLARFGAWSPWYCLVDTKRHFCCCQFRCLE